MFSLGGWSPLLPTRFLVSRSTLVPPKLYLFSCTGLSPSLAVIPIDFPLKGTSYIGGPQPRNARVPVWAPPLSLAATYGIDLSFLSSGYLDVSVHRVPPTWLCIGHAVHEGFSCGFPHSDICGSRDICSSPQLFAAYHVFHRRSVPRHPPRVLLRLTFALH